ncbi:hypothetical protein JXA32_11150 [Candidatus Sumerlaeota bacterium]|nr:hypothetical protein [Candidatus Sumerlaeota bacterium]
MPSTINGIGTWYYGKRNSSKRHGMCEHCGKEAVLESYDATLYFVFLYIPVIPLKKVKVFDECSRCRRHRVAKLEEYEAGKRRKLDDVQRTWREDPGNLDKAKNALGAFAAFRQSEGFNAFADEVIGAFPDNVELYEIIGDIQAAFKMLDEALVTLDRGLHHDSAHEGLRESVADVYIRKLQPDQATPYLQHILDQRDASKVNYFYRQACSYQSCGRHREALEAMERCSQLAPEIERDKGFRKIRRQSEKLFNSDKRIEHKWLMSQTGIALPDGGSYTPGFARWIFPVILVFGFIIYLLAAWSAGTREIYFINGLSKPYTVEVNGVSRTLEPHEPATMRLEEGEIPIRVTKGYQTIEDQTVSIKTPFFSRPFIKRAYVVNPDGAAALLKQQTFYVPEDSNREPPNGAVHILTGDNMYALQGVQYYFQPFPESISMSEHSTAESRWRVDDLMRRGNYSAQLAYQIVMEYTSPEATQQWLMAQLQHDRDDDELIALLLNTVGVEEFLSIAKPRLDERPVLIDWQRAVQNVREIEGDYDTMLAEYYDALEQDPENKALLYLAARQEPDVDRSRELLLRAAAEPEPCPHAFAALSFHHQALGEYAEAEPYARQAAERMPESAQWRDALIKALRANDKTQEAYELMKRTSREEPDNISVIEQRIYLQMELEGAEAAEKSIESFIRQKEATLGADTAKFVGEIIRCNMRYLSGDKEGCRQIAEENGLPYWLMMLQMESGAPDPLQDLELTSDSLDLIDQAALYVHLCRAGRDQEAEQYFPLLVEQLSQMGREARVMAEILRNADASRVDEALKLILEPGSKASALLILSERVPSRRKDCLAMAARLRTEKQPPTYMIEQWLKE